MKKHIFAFIGGFVSTLVFHQGLVALAYMMGAFPAAPYNMAPTAPLGVPSVISISFFGGLWGILIWYFIEKDALKMQVIKAIVFGAVGPTAVAFIVVFPLKGIAPPWALIPAGLVLNGAWGLGLWIFMKLVAKKA